MTRKADIGMTLEEIAEAEGLSVGAVGMLLSRALPKLRRAQGLLLTCRELAAELERGRNVENTVRTARRGQP